MKNKMVKLGAIFLSISLLFIGCGKSEQKKIETSTKEVGNSNINNSSNQVTNGEKVEPKNNTSVQNNTKSVATKYEFKKTTVGNNVKIEFNTPWVFNDDKSKGATIVGKGEVAAEEGVGEVFIKENNIINKFELINNAKQYTPKSLTWSDRENILVVIGFGNGTVSRGGDIYSLDTKENKLYLVYETKNIKKEIISIKKNGNKLELDVNVYEDEMLNKSHKEKWTIENFDSNLANKIIIKDASGKTIDNIN